MIIISNIKSWSCFQIFYRKKYYIVITSYCLTNNSILLAVLYSCITNDMHLPSSAAVVASQCCLCGVTSSRTSPTRSGASRVSGCSTCRPISSLSFPSPSPSARSCRRSGSQRTRYLLPSVAVYVELKDFVLK